MSKGTFGSDFEHEKSNFKHFKITSKHDLKTMLVSSLDLV